MPYEIASMLSMGGEFPLSAVLRHLEDDNDMAAIARQVMFGATTAEGIGFIFDNVQNLENKLYIVDRVRCHDELRVDSGSG